MSLVAKKIKTNQFKLPIWKLKMNMIDCRMHKNWILIFLRNKSGITIPGDIYPQVEEYRF